MAITNVATLGYEIGTTAVCDFSSETMYLPLLWSFLSIVIHLFGTSTLYAGIKPLKKSSHRDRPIQFTFSTNSLRKALHPALHPREPSTDESPSRRVSTFASIKRFIAATNQLNVRIPVVYERKIYLLFLAWFTLIQMACDVIFGTLTVSSVLPVSVRENPSM